VSDWVYGRVGIGKGLVKAYLSQPNTTVIASVRDINHASVADLYDFKVESGSSLIVIQIDSASNTDAETSINELKSKYSGITSLDTVIANAGLGIHWDKISDATPSQAEENFTVNAAGPMRLFHATFPLLSAAPKPRFIVISTVFGSMEMQSELQLPNVVYGMSKAAVNFFTRKVHYEYSNLIAFPLHPGYVIA
jgi:norsolorinic acid ketoreductase